MYNIYILLLGKSTTVSYCTSVCLLCHVFFGFLWFGKPSGLVRVPCQPKHTHINLRGRLNWHNAVTKLTCHSTSDWAPRVCRDVQRILG